jgi:TonB-linked SusC/RagA family outer membrane protein
MKKILLLFLVLICITISNIYAQNKKITGSVTGSDDGSPLPGVSVKIDGTSFGTQTDPDGHYSISLPANARSITFSLIGYDKQTITVGGASVYNVKLTSNNKQLTEVVVVGYGTQERRDLTGSVGKVSGAAIADLPTPSFDKALAGRVTGVRVTESSGLLGTAPTIRVRGTNSLSFDVGPLYVVDGIPVVTGNQSSVVSNNPLGDINPEDIESIEVLKDGSASAIYGSRASSGVVLITTKKGKSGRQTVNYNMWTGESSTSKRLSILDAAQFITINNEKLTNAGGQPQAFPTLDPSGKPYDTNWQNVVFQRGFQQNHAISVSGGNDRSNYYVSAGFSDLTGDVVDNSQRKYNVRANVEQKALNNVLTFGFTSSVSYVQNLGLNTGTNALSGNVTNALLVFPNVPVMNPDGSYNISASGTVLGAGSNTKQIDNNYTNIKYILDNNIYKNQNLTFTGTSFIDAKIISGLNVRSQIGINSLYGEDYQYWNPNHGDGRPNGYLFQQYLPTFNYDWVNTITYNKEFGNHKINFVAGTELQKTRSRSFFAQGTGLSNTFFGPNNIISGTTATPTIGGDELENDIKSVLARGSYSFKDRYLLTLTYRIDYISNLGIANKPAQLPGASLGWRISDENFFKDASSLKFINDLKLRASYARTGNTNIGNYPFASSYAPGQYGSANSIAFSRLGNPSLVFEQTDKIDFGFDLSMLNSRITLVADYFNNKDNNLIQNVPIAPSLGVPSNIIAENVGNMYNQGFELGVNSLNIKTKDFSWSSGFNLTLIKNKVTNLYGGLDLLSTYNITRVGYAINSFYGYKYLGVNPANGNPLYLKGNGQQIQGDVAKSTYYNYDPANPTVETTQNSLSSTADRSVLANALPTYYGSINNTFTYKGFDLGIYFTFSGGNAVYNATRQESLVNQFFNNNGTEILQRWTTPGQITNVPKLYYGNGNFINVSGSTNSRFLEDGKFLRAQEITLGYSLSKPMIEKLKLSRVRIYGQVQNAFILTPYKGLDPEVANTIASVGTGVDFNANPRPRTFVLGLNVGF